MKQSRRQNVRGIIVICVYKEQYLPRHERRFDWASNHRFSLSLFALFLRDAPLNNRSRSQEQTGIPISQDGRLLQPVGMDTHIYTHVYR